MRTIMTAMAFLVMLLAVLPAVRRSFSTGAPTPGPRRTSEQARQDD